MEKANAFIDTGFSKNFSIDKEILEYCFASAFSDSETQSLNAVEFSELTKNALWLAGDYQDNGINIKTLERVERWQKDIASGEQDIYDLSYFIHMKEVGFAKRWEKSFANAKQDSIFPDDTMDKDVGTEEEQAVWREAAKKEYSNHLTYLIKCYFPAKAVEEMLKISSGNSESCRYINAYGSEALVAACKRGDAEIVECLYSKGATLFPEGKDHSYRLFAENGEYLVSSEIQALISMHDPNFPKKAKEIDVKNSLPPRKVSIKERMQKAAFKCSEDKQHSKDLPSLAAKQQSQVR